MHEPVKRHAGRYWHGGARLGTLLCLLLMGVAHSAVAAEIEGVTFAGQYQSRSTALHLNCTGLLRYMVFIKGYVAALYLGDGVQPDNVLADVPKRLEINYFYAIKGRDFAHATDQGIAQNTDAKTRERLHARIEELDALYEDVKPGDRYALTYLPDVGMELALNGQPKGVIAGADFAAAVFAIWLGPQPLDGSLKSQLLHCS